jgi:HAD superfamily hydrolase (TIGR01509 family)
MHMQPPKAKLAIFDLFGVVFSKGLAGALPELQQAFRCSAEQIRQAYTQQEKAFDSGTINETQFWGAINQALHTDVASVRLSQIVISSYKINADTVRLTQSLRKDHTVIACSNFRKSWFDRLDDRFHVSSLFERVYISSETGLLKPDPRVFDLICSDYPVQPSQTCLLDDDADNVASFRQWGGNGILFTDADAAAKQL